METSVKAAEVLVPPQPEVETPEGEVAAPPAACSSSSASSDFFDPMEAFGRRLEDIISTYGSAAGVPDKQSPAAVQEEKEAKEDITVAMETEVSLIRKSLNKLPSPEQKLEDLIRKYAEMAALRRSDERKLCVLQQRLSVLQDESRSSVAARSKLESLCRELQEHHSVLREETLRRCREDEEKRKEMTSQFQMMLTEIQTQIEQHSARNDKLCHENTNLTDKLESLMSQCELREESLEKINKRRDLQQKLTEAKLQQANALLAEVEEKHKREKEYLLREAIDKTKKCFAMKEQELAMKKKLTLYAQKFDEFQATLAKSNEIYAHFKKEMDNMSDKMKKMDKESNLWKTRFENCNKALTDMIEERAEKGKEYELFVLKIQKLEKLCRALQEERVILYDKIKEVRQANSNIPSKVFNVSNREDIPDTEGTDKPALLTPVELLEIQEEDPVLSEDMARLKEEQAKLQAFAASLLATPSDDEEEDKNNDDPEEDVMANAFVNFKIKTQVQEEAVAVPLKPEVAESAPTKPDKVEEAPKPVVSPPEAPTPVEDTSEMTPADVKPEAVKVQTQVEEKEVQPVKPAEEVQLQTAQNVPTSEPEKISPPTDPKPEATQAEIFVEACEVKPVFPVREEKVQTEPVKAPVEAPTKSESTPPPVSQNAPKTPAASCSDSSSKKQTPKKKKKRNSKNTS